jgi:ElaA protein
MEAGFSDLTARRMYDILQLRSEVFVVEQDCVYQDMDDLDRDAWHILAYGSGRLMAYARLLGPGTRFEEASIGRIVTSPKIRRTGTGRELVSRSIELCRTRFKASRIRISAQCYLESFYSSFGFCVDSAVYQEDGIDHQEMLLEI